MAMTTTPSKVCGNSCLVVNINRIKICHALHYCYCMHLEWKCIMLQVSRL